EGSGISEQFLCSICLEVFSEPVSTPCGHNFCKRCISQTWDTNESCFCPLCKEVFSIRPQLKTNTLLSEMVSHAPRLKRHQLMEPVDDLEDRMCPTHDQPLMIYCSTDQKAICVVCSALEHKNHTLVSLKEAFEQEKVSLQQTVAENQRLVEQRRLKVQEITLETSLSQKFNKVFTQLPPKDQLRRVQQFAVDVTLDPDSANPELVLSKDLKQVHHTDVEKKLRNSPQRFANYAIVLGKQSFSSGRFYFEVQVKGKTMWDLGVARESVNRKGEISASPKNGFWTIVLRNRDQYIACDDPRVPLSPLRPPQKVGVFVDYGAGLVSFYDVDSPHLLYCCFALNLFPVLSTFAF
uniref:Uncharacterized protein n=1 Tax=Neogobius melanostomus TaxID=47308 RepID=A0A8C6WLN2_9GOBI